MTTGLQLGGERLGFLARCEAAHLDRIAIVSLSHHGPGLVGHTLSMHALGMQIHRGRLIDHVQLVVKDLAASKRFYEAVMKVLEIPAGPTADDYFNFDELWVSTADSEGAQGELTGRVHLAFAAKDRATVEAFHRAATTAGGRDNGKPGERPYHPGYFAAFVLDPDGNNIEVVYHGEGKYSAPSITITW